MAEYRNQDVLAAFMSDELKEGLDIFEALSSGNKKTRYNCLLELIDSQSQTSDTTNTTLSSSSKKSIILK